MEKISKRLNQALKIRDMKPIELSEKAKISKGAISSYLSGKYLPKSKYVYKMAKVLNINPVWLLGYDVEMEISSINILATDKIVLWDDLYGYQKNDEINIENFCNYTSLYYKSLIDLIGVCSHITDILSKLVEEADLNIKTKKLINHVFDNFKEMEELITFAKESAVNSKKSNLAINNQNIKLLQLIELNKEALSKNLKSKKITNDEFSKEMNDLEQLLSKELNSYINNYKVLKILLNQNKGDKDDEN